MALKGDSIMFKTTPQDFFGTMTKAMATVPKTPADVKEVMEKVQRVYTAETKNFTECVKTYQKASTGDASANEIAAANKQAQSLAVAARFAALMSVPGGIFMIPALKEVGFKTEDFVPASVQEEFNL